MKTLTNIWTCIIGGAALIVAASVVYVFIKAAMAPSAKQLNDEINNEEFKRHFRGKVTRIYEDRSDRGLPKVVLSTSDTTIEFWPRFIESPRDKILPGDSLIKKENTFTYEVQRGDTTFLIQVQPMSVY